MSTSRSMAWCMWMTASIFYAYQNILRVMPNIMLNDIMQQFNIDAAIFGQMSGVYYIGYAMAHLPIGLMLDRHGPKNVLPLCIIMTTLGLMPILFAEHWAYAITGRALIGIGSSAAILGTFKIIRMAFEEKDFSKMLGFAVFVGLLGSVYGGGPISQMCAAMGYQAVVKIVAVAGLVLAAITYIIIPNIDGHEQNTVISDIKNVFTNYRVLLVCLSAGMMVGPMEGFADVWGAAFLKQIYGFDITGASYTTSMIFMGMCAGSLLIPFLADATHKHLGIMIVCGIIMMLCFAALLVGLLNTSSMIISFFVVGICCAYQIVAVYKASTYVSEHMVGLTIAAANMMIMVFGYAFHAAIGYVVQANGGAQSNEALVYGISVIPLALAIGVMGFMVLSRQEAH